MPVLVDPKSCVDRDHCFAAGACPYGAFYHNSLKRTWEVDATICGECPGPCLNFCDKDALRWGDDLVDLKLVKAELEGAMKPEQVSLERQKHKDELKALKAAEEAAAAAAKQKSSAEGVIDLTLANFEREVLRSGVPVAVDCWADWCGPCKQFSPIFEALAKQYVGVVKFAKLDTDAEPALAQGLGVQSLPSVLLFYKGQMVNMVEGALPAEQFQSWLYQTLAAVRQYEKQLSSEAEEAIAAAVKNLAALGAMSAGPGGRQPASTGPQPPTPSPAAQPADSHRPEPPGKRTSSGLYIP